MYFSSIVPFSLKLASCSSRSARFWLLPVILTVLTISSSPCALAFDGARSGFVLGGGAGYGLVDRISMEDGSSDESGLGFNLHSGWAWNDRNMLLAFFESGRHQEGIRQGYLGPLYVHYLMPVSNSWLLMGGVGLKYTDGLDDEEPRLFEWDYDRKFGPGFVVGSGYEFIDHLSVTATLSYGKVEDFKLTHLLLAVHATAY